MSQLADALAAHTLAPAAPPAPLPATKSDKRSKSWKSKGKSKPKSIDAVPAPQSALERRKLWPLSAEEMANAKCVSVIIHGQLLSRDGKHTGGVPYFETFVGVKRGGIRVFFYGPLPGAKPGTKVVGDVSVWEKTLPDGRQFLYVNCSSDPGAVATAQLVVHGCAEQYRAKPQTLFGISIVGTEGALEIRTPLPKTAKTAPPAPADGAQEPAS